MQPKNILIIIRQAPYSTLLPVAALDILLTAAAFEQTVGLLFMGDGVLHLLGNQNVEDSGMKDISKAIPSLELYDVDQIFCEATALARKNIKPDALVFQAEALSINQIAASIENADHVFNF